MIRRRRRVREIPFSFDSFLDIVANVVGIIIRLILVVWVGARSYNSVKNVAAPPAPAAPAVAAAMPDPVDPLQDELSRERRELAEAQKRLLAQLRQLEDVQGAETRDSAHLTTLNTRRLKLEQEQAVLTVAAAEQTGSSRTAALTSDELRQRSARLSKELRELEKQQPPIKTLRFRTPISHPVERDELLFECYRGRVTFIDIAAMLNEVRDGVEEKAKLLRSQWQVTDVSGPSGAFRLHYTVERERGLLDAIGGDRANPSETGSFRYGLSEWHLEAVAPARGESLMAALAAGSEFRQIVDPIAPEHAAVTFWVYPDSFELFRKLRDYLYERDVVVAGRPLPEGMPIASSRRGSRSLGQ
jgi:hypothetical protein